MNPYLELLSTDILIKVLSSSKDATAIYISEQLHIQFVNDAMLQIWGKDESVIGKTFEEAIPEMVGQPFPDLLRKVWHTGQVYVAKDTPADLVVDGKLQTFYFDFEYRAVRNERQETYCLFHTATNVTDRHFGNQREHALVEQLTAANEELIAANEALATSNQKLRASEEQLRLAVESADLGTWFINADTREITPSPRLKEMFGFNADEEMPLDAAINQIAEDYRSTVVQAINAAIEKGESYNIEYPVTGFRDGKIRWVRATGKMYPGVNNQTPIFSGTIMDITGQKQNEQRKNDFIGMVSHELKTPLTSMTAILQVLKAKLDTSEDPFVPVALQKANQQVKKMSSMINGFLNISRLEAGRIQIDKKVFDLDQLLAENTKEIELIFPGHMIEYMPCGPVMVNADRDKIESVISNLLSNAIKYSPKGSLIDLKCQTVADSVRVSTKDRGIGIKEEDQTKLFDRYYRVESTAAHISGFGIGLYLSAEIIDRHNGRIWLESEIGKGSTFYFSLPHI